MGRTAGFEHKLLYCNLASGTAMLVPMSYSLLILPEEKSAKISGPPILKKKLCPALLNIPGPILAPV
jgi:hypothetical protein